jgi:hypothetical protein
VSTIRLIAAGVALLIALVVPVAAVSAATADECSAQIGQIQGAVATASFANAKDQAALDSKLGAAQQKLAQGKTTDAIEKLIDFTARVTQLSATGKLAPADADALLSAADAAIRCVRSISPTT